jgi:hypothetical protein
VRPAKKVPSHRILSGENEPIFGVLPGGVLANLRKPASETAVIWNLFYPRARPTLSLAQWMALPPLAGTAFLSDDDQMTPYYWGYAVDGTRLAALQEAQRVVDGEEACTEIDVVLLGSRNVVVIEAKNLATLGRCDRYRRGRCPEVHVQPPSAEADARCRYWEGKTARFSDQLEFGDRPRPAQFVPPCSRHYQLARVLLVGSAMARMLDKRLHLWLLTSQRRWPALKHDWGDLTSRIRDDELWRRSRVLAWEAIAKLPAG